MSTSHFHHICIDRLSSRRRRYHRQQPHFRRLLAGKVQVVNVVSLHVPGANRLSRVTNCLLRLLNRAFVFLYGLHGAFLGAIRRTIHMRCFHTLLRSHGHHVDDSTDRRQPLYHRVSTVKGVSVVHQLDGEETVGCSACICSSVQHRTVSWLGSSVRIHQRTAYSICLLILPICMLTLLNIRLMKALNIHRRMQMQNRSIQKDVSIVIVVVIICQLPQLSNVVSLGPMFACGSYHFYLRGISDTPVVLNSAVNFIIYILCN